MGELLTLGFGFSFEDLYVRDGLVRLDQAFRANLAKADIALAEKFAAARQNHAALTARDESDLLLAIAPYVDSFLTELFGIDAEADQLLLRHKNLDALYAAKRLFVQRRAAKAHKPEEAATFDGDALRAELEAHLGANFDEMIFAQSVVGWMKNEKAETEKLAIAARYAAWALFAQDGRARHEKGLLFQLPARRDAAQLVAVAQDKVGDLPALAPAPNAHLRQREGFALTDCGTDLAGALDHANYCIFCHHQGKDSCSRGMIDKRTNGFAVNALGVEMAGCPLGEKISEMHEAKTQGLSLAALGLIVVDNPMAAGTGHRICNDCMTACIYQNQSRDPVNIPEAETRALKDVLELPWGFEIYGLLTRWNPFNLRRPLPKPSSGRKVLVAGLGPAGFTLAHHLLNEGHAVAAIDGLKIEPLPSDISGVDHAGARVSFRPIRDIASLWENLGARVMAGFGGVAEYGITVRWDKNFLKVIRLLLERRADFAMFGGVRLGGQITVESAFAMGFDHLALCMGAGKPTILSMKNGLARGVRQASDFLMALQLTGAARSDTLANLQIRLPVVVIGGGLTAIDTCTEALAYYPVQVEKFLTRYEVLVAEKGAKAVRAAWSAEETQIADEFISHAVAIRAERAKAKAEGRAPNINALLLSWGGASIAYRRRMTDSPAYRNHEEITKAFEEGIRFIEQVTPIEVVVDRFGHAEALRVKTADGRETQIAARSIVVAAGTIPNTVLAREEGGFTLDGKYFQAFDEAGAPVSPQSSTKPQTPQVLASLRPDGRAISFFGDLHPSFAGNVVSAMASAKQGHAVISRMLAQAPASSFSPVELFSKLNRDLRARVHSVRELAPSIVEVVLEAPAAARAFRPGQFYRLQNFETLAVRTEDTTLAMEGLALTGAWVDAEKGLVSVIALEMGGSSDLCRHLKPGEPVVLMGPTGAPTEISAKETVLLAGGGLGNAVLFSIGAALRAAGSRVLYFAGYRRPTDRFKQAEIEAAADLVVWCADEGPAFASSRPQDKSFVGNIVAAMTAYAKGELGPVEISLKDVDRVIAIGSDRMMAAVGEARHAVLAPFLKAGHEAIASINSPMQCMMKEICAQCLQTQRDPQTGAEKVVFTCFNQDQPLDWVVFPVLRERLSQNAVQEKLTRQWIDRSLIKLGLRA